MIRKPAVAGVFYPSEEDILNDTIRNLFLGPLGPGEVPEIPEGNLDRTVGLISPHAGYIYSGQVAAWGYLELSKHGRPSTVILMGPNHTGYGPAVSVFPEGIWETPLGELEIDERAASIIMDKSMFATPDFSAHVLEHSLEVQLPFLQFLYGNSFKIVPIILKDQSPSIAEDLAHAISAYVSENPSIVIASTDLNHYENQSVTVRKDALVMEAIEENDPEKLYNYIYNYDITMCGYGTVATLMFMEMGKPRILKHATSGDVSGDNLEVVGYLSAIYD